MNIAQRSRPFSFYPWGGKHCHPDELGPHYALIGMVGSAKTLSLLMLANAVLQHPQRGLCYRALIYDPKRDLYPYLVGGIGIPPHKIWVLHPFDARSAAWDLARDFTTNASVLQLSNALAPPDKQSSQPFFSIAACDVLGGAINNIRGRANDWGLNDVLEATSTQQELRHVLESSAEGQRLISIYLANHKTASDVIATLRSKLAPFATVGRLWARARTRVSLTEWATSKDPSVLLLGSDDANCAALDPINQAIFQRASELVTTRPDEYPSDESWFFLDEARLAKALDNLPLFLLKSRSKGGHLVLGFQDILGMRDVYGRDVAEEIVGQCGNLAVLKLSNPDTMEWASRFFGEYEAWVEGYSHSSSAQGGSSTVSESLQRRQAILPQEFRLFPPPSPSRGIPGVFATQSGDAWRTVVPPDFIATYLPRPAAVPGFVPRPTTDQAPLPWTNADRKRLGISLVAPAPTQPTWTAPPTRPLRTFKP